MNEIAAAFILVGISIIPAVLFLRKIISIFSGIAIFALAIVILGIVINNFNK